MPRRPGHSALIRVRRRRTFAAASVALLGASLLGVGVVRELASQRALESYQWSLERVGGGQQPMPLTSHGTTHVLQCSNDSIALVSDGELLGVDVTGAVRHRRQLEGTVMDADCISGELRVLEVNEQRLRLLRFSPDASKELAPAETYLSQHVWMDAGLCLEGTFRVFGARKITDALLIERGGTSINGGLGAVR